MQSMYCVAWKGVNQRLAVPLGYFAVFVRVLTFTVAIFRTSSESKRILRVFMDAKEKTRAFVVPAKLLCTMLKGAIVTRKLFVVPLGLP